jgi:hypothetical protein
MRRLIAALVLTLGAVAFAGCGSREFPGGNVCWSDPFHPCATNTPLCYAR